MHDSRARTRHPGAVTAERDPLAALGEGDEEPIPGPAFGEPVGGRVVADVHGLGIAGFSRADFPVSWFFSIPVGVAGGDVKHTRNTRKIFFHTPETATCEIGIF